MDFSGFTITLVTLLQLAACDNEIVTLEINVPDLIKTYKILDKVVKTVAGEPTADVQVEPQSSAERMFMKVNWDGLSNIPRIMKILQSLHLVRRSEDEEVSYEEPEEEAPVYRPVSRPMVEISTGVAKPVPPVDYHPEEFKNKLKYLLKLKALHS